MSFGESCSSFWAGVQKEKELACTGGSILRQVERLSCRVPRETGYPHVEATACGTVDCHKPPTRRLQCSKKLCQTMGSRKMDCAGSRRYHERNRRSKARSYKTKAPCCNSRQADGSPAAGLNAKPFSWLELPRYAGRVKYSRGAWLPSENVERKTGSGHASRFGIAKIFPNISGSQNPVENKPERQFEFLDNSIRHCAVGTHSLQRDCGRGEPKCLHFFFGRQELWPGTFLSLLSDKPV